MTQLYNSSLCIYALIITPLRPVFIWMRLLLVCSLLSESALGAVEAKPNIAMAVNVDESAGGSTASASKVTKSEKIQIGGLRCLPYSFADIVAPLTPAVVNIYTVQYKTKSRRHDFQEFFPFEQFNHMFEQFNSPLMLEEIYSNPRAMSLGSGFIVDAAGLIVTNNHVVSNADEIHIKFANNDEYPAKIIGTDPKTDLALLKIDAGKPLPFVKFGDSGSARVGDMVIAIGNPLGFGGTVTKGIISSKGRDLGTSLDELVDDFIQTDAAINTGNSGGPLFNLNGEVIGVNTAVPAIGGGTNIGIGFAIPSNTAQNIISRLQKSGSIKRGRLDITIQDITEDLADALSLKEQQGVLVVSVLEGGAGQRAGLRQGDIILDFNGTKVTSYRKLQLLVSESDIGEEVKLNILRDGKNVVLNTKILASSEHKRANHANSKGTFQKSGVVFGNITDDIRSKYGLSDKLNGVIVLQLNRSEASKSTSLRKGDLLIAADKKPISNLAEFKQLYNRALQAKRKNIVVLVKRGGFSIFIALPLEQQQQQPPANETSKNDLPNKQPLKNKNQSGNNSPNTKGKK